MPPIELAQIEAQTRPKPEPRGPNGECCGTCIFFRGNPRDIGAPGDCHRYPPTPFLIAFNPETQEAPTVNVWAKVVRHLWCGEFQELPGLDGEKDSFDFKGKKES